MVIQGLQPRWRGNDADQPKVEDLKARVRACKLRTYVITAPNTALKQEGITAACSHKILDSPGLLKSVKI